MTKRSLVILLLATGCLLTGCGKQKAASASHSHGHAHTAPHGGTLVEVGEHRYNLEFRFDDVRGVLQAWILDAHAENFVRVPLREFTVEAKAGEKTHVLKFVAVASTITGETVGDTAQFEAEAAWARTARTFAGEVTEIAIRGTTFADIAFGYPANNGDHEHDHAGHQH